MSASPESFLSFSAVHREKAPRRSKEMSGYVPRSAPQRIESRWTRPDTTPATRAYHRRNRERGKPPGTLRIRLRYRHHVTPFFDWLCLSPRELEQVVAGTGWHVARLVQLGGAPPYIAVLEKD
jgi:hypothetical protein